MLRVIHVVAMALILVMSITSCAAQKTADDDTCLDTGITFELSKQLMTPQDTARSVAALDAALADIGFTQSHDVAGRFDALIPTAAIRYMKIRDEHYFVFQNGGETPVGPSEIHVAIFGACGNTAQVERKKYADSIKGKIETALQPYATEKVVIRDASYIEVD